MKRFWFELKQRFKEDPWFFSSMAVGMIMMSLAISVYAYLGIYSRYLADDYCETLYFRVNGAGELIDNLLYRYLHISSRLGNILFVGLSQLIFGSRSVSILPAIMVILFVGGLYKAIREAEQLARLKLGRSLDFLLAASVAFFSLYEAPNLYQTVYWRSGMATHFAPLVFLLYMGSFILHRIRVGGNERPAYRVQGASFIGFLVLGSFSEPPTTTMITVFLLSIFAIYLSSRMRLLKSALVILSWSLAGSTSALMIMALAPANSLRLQTPPPGLVELLIRIITYPIDFIVDTLRTLPVPTLVSVVLMSLLSYFIYTRRQPLSSGFRTQFILLLLGIPLIMYILIAASFAPSAYGQSYPVERARFAGRLLMTIALMMEGSILGVWIAQIKTEFVRSQYARIFLVIVFGLLALYPLRAAWLTFRDIPEFRASAAAWDLRDSEIHAMIAEGQQNLKVRLLPGRYQIKEIDALPNHWVNKCVAEFYNIETIVSVPMDK